MSEYTSCPSYAPLLTGPPESTPTGPSAPYPDYPPPPYSAAGNPPYGKVGSVSSHPTGVPYPPAPYPQQSTTYPSQQNQQQQHQQQRHPGAYPRQYPGQYPAAGAYPITQPPYGAAYPAPPAPQQMPQRSIYAERQTYASSNERDNADCFALGCCAALLCCCLMND